jgi:hypothetical protein
MPAIIGPPGSATSDVDGGAAADVITSGMNIYPVPRI